MRPLFLAGSLVFLVACGHAEPPAPRAPSPAPAAAALPTTAAPTKPSLDTASGPRLTARSQWVFEGNTQLPSSELLAVVALGKDLPENRNIDPSAILARDVLWVTAAYYDRGFLTVQTDEPRLEATEDGSVRAHLNIREGAQFRVGTVTVEEHDANGKSVRPLGAPKALRSRIPMESGQVFSRSALVRGLDSIRRLYRDAGYASVTADPLMELDTKTMTANVVVPIRRMDLTYVDGVHIRGHKKVPEEAIRKEVRMAKGKLFSETAIEQTRQGLLASGRFESVEIALLPKGSEKAVTIEITVSEK